MVNEYKKEKGTIKNSSQANELAKIMVEAAIDKFKNPKQKKTPYQRKYKKTYNATWEVSNHRFIKVYIFREEKKMISLFSYLLQERLNITRAQVRQQ
jgi:hypothetical protein